jgi:SAM-dependent methyltransferase
METVLTCTCCGSSDLHMKAVLWPELIAAWELSEAEVASVDRQQGLHCVACGANVRSMTLAHGIMSRFGYRGLFRDFVSSPTASSLAVLEINEAGSLTSFLSRIPGHVIVRFPETDMMKLPFADGAFNLVVHSDTLEHVPDPVVGLRECRRVLAEGGACAYTVPLIIGRLTRSRTGLPASYHSSPENPPDNLVHTEYGADAWAHPIMAGFGECRIVTLEHPTAHALIAMR